MLLLQCRLAQAAFLFSPVERGVLVQWNGYLRTYYLITGKTLILLMHGGTKGTQDADIKEAHAILDRLKERQKKIERGATKNPRSDK